MFDKEAYQKNYAVVNGIITRNGKFVHEAEYVPFLWEQAVLLGFAEDYGNNYYSLDLIESDILLFPQLKGKKTVWLHETNDGFVYEIENPALCVECAAGLQQTGILCEECQNSDSCPF